MGLPALTTTRRGRISARDTMSVELVTAEMLVEAATVVAMAAGAAAAVTEVAMVDDIVRFVAFSAIDGQPWEAGASAAALLELVRSLSSLGIGLTRCTEILDCGAEADEVLREGVSLDQARRRFLTVFRGEDCGPGVETVEVIPETGEAAGVPLRDRISPPSEPHG